MPGSVCLGRLLRFVFSENLKRMFELHAAFGV